ncbi:MAG TPA: hypothetical protein VIL25_02705 [Vicinamibacterales bacterium]
MGRLLTVGVLAGATAAGIAVARVARDPGVLPAPAATVQGWVEFRAAYRQVRDGRVEAVGVFHRGRDGSTRRETRDPDGTLRFVAIENIAENRYYGYAGGAWSAQPLRLLAPRVPPGPRPDLLPVSERVEGLELQRELTPEGAVLLRAPALNFFPVVEYYSDPPMSREHHDIVIGPVDPALFRPPAVPVDELPWPYLTR